MEKCEYCYRIFRRQERKDLTEGLTWLDNEKKLVCELCLRHKIPLVGVE